MGHTERLLLGDSRSAAPPPLVGAGVAKEGVRPVERPAGKADARALVQDALVAVSRADAEACKNAPVPM